MLYVSIFLILLLINIILKKEFKNLKFLWFLLVMAFIVQIFYNSYGKVLFNFFNIFITENGISAGISSIFKILDIALIANLINFEKLLKYRIINEKFYIYKLVIEKVIKLSPDIFTLFKQKLNIKKVFRLVLVKAYKELEE